MTWWSDRWQSACLDDMIDPNPQVDAGLALASKSRATIVHLESGLVQATVRDRKDYGVTIGIQQLHSDVFVDLARDLAAVPLLCASILTSELPIEVDGILLAKGIMLIPSASQVLADCECDEYHSPCRHGVATLVAIADLIAADPFTLTHLRGGPQHQIVGLVRDHRGLTQTARHSDEPRGPDRGTPAAAAFRRSVAGSVPSELSPRAAAPPGPLMPPPPLDSGLIALELQALVLDAAQRSVQLLRGEGDGSLRQSVDADLARRSAAALAAGTSLAGLSQAAGVEEAELVEQARCWDIGGPAALAVRVDSWVADPIRLEAARQLFTPRARASQNIVSSGDIQLRLDQDGLWWRFMAHPSKGWLLDSAGFANPAEAFDDQL